ncbi:MAG TPA: tetratricopeptide repeat protein [Armatimonadota bacterium]|nr:tetratricopeptide repeat protein [Armatimonadota bacterium]
MVCPSCQTLNFRDFKFCRECGTHLPLPDPNSPDDGLSSQVERLLEQAFTLLDQGSADEAALAAQGALALNPDSASAHSILGLIYERQGRKTDAIQEFQQVLALNPGSVADREKLNELLGASAGSSARSGLRLTPAQGALAAAAVAAVLVFGTGIALLAQPSKPGRAQSGAARLAPSRALPAPNPPGVGLTAPAPATNAGTLATVPAKPVTAHAALPPAAATARSANPAPWHAPQSWPALHPWRAPAQTAQAMPEQRVGLPPVINTPRPAPQPTGLAPAAIGEVIPLTPPAAAKAAPSGPVESASSAPQPGVGNGASPAAAPAPKPEARRREPLEPETGFIRIGPAKPSASPHGAAGAPAPAAAPARPLISVKIGGAGEGSGTAPRQATGAGS